MGAEAALARLPALRPSLADRPPTTDLLPEVAVSLGAAVESEIDLYVTIEETMVLVAPPREGKTSQIILPGIRNFPGTVLATSSKVDVLYATAKLRAKFGPVWVCDPTDLSGWPQQMRWSLTAGCEEFTTARKRAETLTSATKSGEGTKNGGYFVKNAQMLITCWLHAAALDGRPTTDVLEWARSPNNQEAVDILSQYGKDALAGALSGQHGAAEEERSATWRTAEQPFIALYDDKVAGIFAPKEPNFDIEQWLTEGGTLFLIGEDDEESALAPINAAFARAVFDCAKRLAARQPNGRLDPPFAFWGDEIANVAPLPQIPSLMSVSGSQNIFVCIVIQSYPQAQERWGDLGVRKIFSSATVKVLLGGISDDQELKMYSTLVGEFDEETESVSDDSNGHMSVSTSLRRRAVLDPADIRMIPERQGLIIHRRTPAVMSRFTRAHEGPLAKEIAAATEWAHEQVRNTHGQ
jgi:type IV secretory pathway TraG/TraD family ATPase VirD4